MTIIDQPLLETIDPPVLETIGSPDFEATHTAESVRHDHHDWWVVVRVVVIVAVWALSSRSVDPRTVTDIGLIGKLPVLSLLSYVAITASLFSLFRRHRLPMHLVWLHLVAFTVMLFGLNPLMDTVPRLNVVWRHVGVAEHIAQTKALDPRIDAYFNWPGFFPFLSSLSSLMGLDSPLALAPYAPIAFNLAYLLPVDLMLRTATHDRRIRSFALLLFLLGNWVGQDYLSPQALGYFLSLVLLAVLMQFFRKAGDDPRGNRVILIGATVLLFASIVPMHQLTPIAVLVCVTTLVLFRQCRLRTLPLIMGLVVLIWLAFGASTYFRGNLKELLGGIGDLGKMANDNVGSRLGGSSGHKMVTRTRMLVTGSMWMLAFVGIWLRARSGKRDTAGLVLTFSPLLMFGLLSYGGEMIMRVQLFSLPFASFFAAAACMMLFQRQHRSSAAMTWYGNNGRTPDGWVTDPHEPFGSMVVARVRFASSVGWTFVLMATVVAGLLTAGFLTNRYGNDRFDWFSRDEVAVVSAIPDLVAPGSRVLAPTGHLPWISRSYNTFDYGRLTSRIPLGGSINPVDLVRALHTTPNGCGFVILTRSEEAYNDIYGVWPRGDIRRLRDELSRSDKFVTVSANSDAALFLFRGKVPAREKERLCLQR